MASVSLKIMLITMDSNDDKNSQTSNKFSLKHSDFSASYPPSQYLPNTDKLWLNSHLPHQAID